MTRTAAACVLLLLTALAGCGGTSDDDQAARSIARSIMAGQGSGGSGGMVSVKRPDADCIGQGFVDKIGVAKLQKYKFLDKNLKTTTSMTTVAMQPADAAKATDVLFGCTDVQAMVQDAIAQQGSLKSLDAKTRKCIGSAFDEPALRPLFQNLFAGKQTQAQQALSAPLMKCVAGALPTN